MPAPPTPNARFRVVELSSTDAGDISGRADRAMFVSGVRRCRRLWRRGNGRGELRDLRRLFRYGGDRARGSQNHSVPLSLAFVDRELHFGVRSPQRFECKHVIARIERQRLAIEPFSNQGAVHEHLDHHDGSSVSIGRTENHGRLRLLNLVDSLEAIVTHDLWTACGRADREVRSGCAQLVLQAQRLAVGVSGDAVDLAWRLAFRPCRTAVETSQKEGYA